MTDRSCENYILRQLPSKLSVAVYAARDKLKQPISEIRIRAGHRVMLTVNGSNLPAECILTKDEIGELVYSLCACSMYAHADTINRGYISASHGIRIGICGRAVADGETITAVRDFTSLCIRIPRRYPGSGDVIKEVLETLDRPSCVLLYSPPGVGKTTALREYCASEEYRRVAVVDTRGELGFAAADSEMCDILEGYPRASGIECALRSMSPEVIVTDEIGNESDRIALESCATAGVCVVASVHGSDVDEITDRGPLAGCFARGIIGAMIGLRRDGERVAHDVRYIK